MELLLEKPESVTPRSWWFKKLPLPLKSNGKISVYLTVSLIQRPEWTISLCFCFKYLFFCSISPLSYALGVKLVRHHKKMQALSQLYWFYQLLAMDYCHFCFKYFSRERKVILSLKEIVKWQTKLLSLSFLLFFYH